MFIASRSSMPLCLLAVAGCATTRAATALLLCMLPAIVADRIITIGRSAAGRPTR